MVWGGRVPLHDGDRPRSGTEILADEAVRRDGVYVCHDISRPRRFGDRQGSDGHYDKRCARPDPDPLWAWPVKGEGEVTADTCSIRFFTNLHTAGWSWRGCGSS